VEISWSDAALDFGGSTFVASSSPMKICQNPNDHHGPPAGTEILQDSCEDGSGPHMYVGQVETVQLVCRTPGAFTLHLVTYAEDSLFGSTLIDHNSNPVPTGTTDATIVCAEATATPTVTNTATATATPTNTAAPVRVGGVADVHVVTDDRLVDGSARNDSSPIRRAIWMSLVMAAALSIAAGAWYFGTRRQR
jgi:hypothetical protein